MGSKIIIPITKPLLGDAETEHVRQVIQSGWVSQGPKVKEFEKAFADYVGAKHAVAVSSCTTALHLSLLASGVKSGDEVITPSHTFIATANSIAHCGAIPVFVDIDPRTFNLDPDRIEAAITRRTKAIMIVHQIGLPADIGRITKIAKRHGLEIVEDAACAIGSEYKNRPIGCHSRTVCFSFHPRKIITTGDGGMVTTNDAALAKKLELLRQHGMSVNDLARHRSKKVIFEEYPIVGYNYRLTDMQAAMGIEQLKRLPKILKDRRRLAERYTDAFSKFDQISPPFVPNYAQPNFQSYCVYVEKGKQISRDVLMQRLLEMGIATRRGVMSVHLEKPYRKSRRPGGLQHSTYASNNALILPLYPQMTEKEQMAVIKAIKTALR